MAYKSYKSKCFFLFFVNIILATVVPADNNVAISVKFKVLWKSETIKQQQQWSGLALLPNTACKNTAVFRESPSSPPSLDHDDFYCEFLPCRAAGASS